MRRLGRTTRLSRRDKHRRRRPRPLLRQAVFKRTEGALRQAAGFRRGRDRRDRATAQPPPAACVTASWEATVPPSSDIWRQWLPDRWTAPLPQADSKRSLPAAQPIAKVQHPPSLPLNPGHCPSPKRVMRQRRSSAASSRQIVCALALTWTGPAPAPINRCPRRTGRDAQVAQLVEHVTENHGVGGSIPPLGTSITL